MIRREEFGYISWREDKPLQIKSWIQARYGQMKLRKNENKRRKNQLKGWNDKKQKGWNGGKGWNGRKG